MAAISVIGVGNDLMGDDGVGVRVAEMLRERIGDADDVQVTVGYLAGMQLMPAVRSGDHVIFADAMAVDAEPGDIFRMDPDEAGITGLRSTTSHGMGIPYLITNSRLLGHSPSFLVYGVQIGDIMIGPDQLTPDVERAADKVVELILEDIERIRAEA